MISTETDKDDNSTDADMLGSQLSISFRLQG